MRTLSFFLIAFSFAAFAKSECSDSLKDLIKSSEANQEIVSEFLNLQAGITLHKIAYAAYRSSGSPQEFKLENEILRLLKERQAKSDSSKEFAKVLKLFQDPNNSVSRTALAKALPYIQNILNDQKKEQNEFERQMFNFGPADIKLVTILAERESFAQGHYGSKFYKDRDDDRSILNFTKVINSSIRNFDEVDPERMSKRISTLQQRAVDLLDKLDISQECKALVRNCVLKRGNSQGLSADFTDSLMAISQELQFPDKYDRLRYNDVWLYAGKGSHKPSKEEKTKNKLEKIAKTVPIIEDLSIAPEVLLSQYYADRVLEVAPSLFSKEELLANPDFARALVKAIDEGLLSEKGKERTFSYKGKIYNFPELWNWESRDKSGGKLKWAWGKAMEVKDKVDDWWPVAGTRRFLQGLGLEALEVVGLDVEEKFSHIDKEDLPDFLTVWNRQKTGYGQEFSFVFQNKIYDIETGEELEKGISLLLERFGTNKKAKFDRDPYQDQGVADIAASEIQNGNESFILNGKVYHLSGARVDFESAYAKAKKEHQELGVRKESFPSKETVEKLKGSPEALKVLTDGKRAYIKGGKAYDLFKGEALTAFEASREVAKNRTLQGVKRSPSDYRGMGQDYLVANAVAALNHEPTFRLGDKKYHSNTGRAVASGAPNSAQAGFINRDIEKNKYESLASNKKALIAAFEKKNGRCEVYGVLDKTQALLKVLDRKSLRIIFSAEVLLGQNKGDERTKYSGGLEGPSSNKKTSAGVFVLGNLDSERGFANNNDEPGLAFGKAGLAQSNLLYDRDLGNNLVTDGSVLMRNHEFEDFKQFLPKGCSVYSLPQTDQVKLIVKDEELQLAAAKGRTRDFHVSDGPKKSPKQIRLKLTEAVEINREAKDFLKALETNKPKIMRDLGISNDEYNELSKIAFGVMGVESQFGEGLEVFPNGFSFKNFLNPRRHKEKAHGGVVVFLGKLLSRGEATIDPDSRSRGLTQIKAVEDYPLIKRFGGIERDNLMEPEKAAVATMYVLGEMYAQLEKIIVSHSGISESNKSDYLYYIYNGQSDQIKLSSATPQLNARARKAMEFSELLDVYER